MSFNTVVFFCAQALLIQTIHSQCIGPYGPYDGLGYGGPLGGPCGAPLAGPWGYNELAGCGPAGFRPTSGGSFAVSSTSPLAPSGISVFSENAIEGTLSVGGVLPFLGTVGLEAVLPTIGTGTIAYGCGNGAVGITAEDYGFPSGPFGPGFPGPGYPVYGPGYGYGPGCGCGPIY